MPEDLEEIQRWVFLPAGGQLASAEKRDGADNIVPAESFALGRERMGMETLFLHLFPPSDLRHDVMDGPWFDNTRPHIIEVDRCFTDGRILRD